MTKLTILLSAHELNKISKTSFILLSITTALFNQFGFSVHFVEPACFDFAVSIHLSRFAGILFCCAAFLCKKY